MNVLADFTLGDLLLSMLVFFFWFLFIWIIITVFIDVFRRDDLSGWAKAGWVVLIIILPLLGALIYLIARPKDLEQDKRELERVQQQQRRLAGYSSAEEVEKLSRLHAEGKLTDEEFQAAKAKAL